MTEVRLQKVIAACGLASRREAEHLIEGGRVTVNGKKVTTLGTKVDPERDRIRLDGNMLQPRKDRERFIYLKLHKPAGVVSTTTDPESRTTVMDLIRDVAPARGSNRVFHVGRLDFFTEGLLLFTNDGQLSHALSHPSSQVPRVYQVKVDGSPDRATLRRLVQGIELDDGEAKVKSLKVVRSDSCSTWVEIMVEEGRNRLVRRLFAELGYKVLRLMRIAFAGITLGDLKPGEVRALSREEVGRLRHFLPGAKAGKRGHRPHG